MLARADTPLKRILEDEGRTQAWLARRLGVSRQSVNFWVHGIYHPSEVSQRRIAGLLGRDVVELFPHLGRTSDQTGEGANATQLDDDLPEAA